MTIIDQILQLEETLAILARQRSSLANKPGEYSDVDDCYRAVQQELSDLIAGLSPEDEQWLETERARVRHGGNTDD